MFKFTITYILLAAVLSVVALPASVEESALERRVQVARDSDVQTNVMKRQDQNKNKGKGNNGGNGGDPQTSLTLLDTLVQKGFETDGQATATAGQKPSLTSKNNFINFCATVKMPLTNGAQVKGGSCNSAPMGQIAGSDKMPSSKFTNPANLATIKANQQFTIKMTLNNVQAGTFVNPNTNYYAAPQQLNNNGVIIGHTHFVVQKLDSLTQTNPADPSTFAFFKGVNTPAQGGAVSVDVPGGLPTGFYRLASINAAANHQPVLVAIAQHGSLDDMVYFAITDDGKAPAELQFGKGNNNGGNNNNNGGNNNNKGGNNNNGGQGNGNGGKKN